MGVFSEHSVHVSALTDSLSHSPNYGSSHRSPTSHLDKDCCLLYPTIYSLLVPAVKRAYCWTSRLPYRWRSHMLTQHHLFSPSEND